MAELYIALFLFGGLFLIEATEWLGGWIARRIWRGRQKFRDKA